MQFEQTEKAIRSQQRRLASPDIFLKSPHGDSVYLLVIPAIGAAACFAAQKAAQPEALYKANWRK